MSESCSRSADIKNAMRHALAGHYPEEDLKRWFDPLRFVHDDKKKLCVEWPHRFFEDWMTDDRLSMLKKTFVSVSGQSESIEQYVTPSPAKRAGQPDNHALSEHAARPRFGDYFLDTFLVNTKNTFPFTIIQEAASGKIVFNPLIVCGSIGSGKTHIARAVGNALTLVHGQDTVYCAAVDELALLAKKHTDEEILSLFSVLHAIIIDDLQQLHVNPRLGDLLPKVIDMCMDSKRLFMATTSQPPAEWSGMPKRVSNRLEQGLVLLVHDADMDIRLRFAQIQNRSMHLNLNRTQLLAIAQQCTGIRSLMGVMQRLQALHQVHGNDLSSKDIDRALDYTSEGRNVSPQQIIKHVASRMNVRAEDITGTKRHPRVARARHIAMYLCRSLLGSSYPALGKVFGGRDHSTVIHSVKKIQLLWDNDKDTHNLLTELSLSCRQSAR